MVDYSLYTSLASLQQESASKCFEFVLRNVQQLEILQIRSGYIYSPFVLGAPRLQRNVRMYLPDEYCRSCFANIVDLSLFDLDARQHQFILKSMLEAARAGECHTSAITLVSLWRSRVIDFALTHIRLVSFSV